MEPTLQNLLTASLARHLDASSFTVYYSQLPPQQQSIAALLQFKSYSSLHVSYILHVSALSGGNFAHLFQNLHTIDADTQAVILHNINQLQTAAIPSYSSLLNDCTLKALSLPFNKSIANSFLYLWLELHTNSGSGTNLYSNTLSKLLTFIKSNDPHNTLISKFNKSLAKNYSKVYKVIWFNAIIINHKYNDLNFVNIYESLFVKNQSKLNLIKDLIITSFSCFISSNSQLSEHWKFFISKKLPQLALKLGINQNLPNCLIDSMNEIDEDDMIHGFDIKDVKLDFIKNCILVGVDSSIYSKLFGSQYRINQDDESFESNFLKLFEDNFTNINFEFISLKESNFLSYLNNIPKLSGPNQLVFTNKIYETILLLIESNDLAKLHELLLAVLLKPKVLQILIYQLSPIYLLSPITKLIDNWENDEDDLNFQETFTNFGIFLLFVTTVVGRTSIKPSSLNLPESSFILKYFSDSDPMISIDENRQNDLEGEWIKAIFDQIAGISDELIKSFSITEIYMLIPNLFKKAISAYQTGNIKYENLINGVEYLNQPFLLCCVLRFNWVVENFWNSERNEFNLLSIQLIDYFLAGNDYNNDAFRALILLIGERLMKALLVFKDSSTNSNDVHSEELNNKLNRIESKILSIINVPDQHHCDIVPFEPLYNQFEKYIFDLLSNSTNYNPKKFNQFAKLIGVNNLINILISCPPKRNVLELIIFIILSQEITTIDERDYWIDVFDTSEVLAVQTNKFGGKVFLNNLWYCFRFQDSSNHAHLENSSTFYSVLLENLKNFKC